MKYLLMLSFLLLVACTNSQSVDLVLYNAKITGPDYRKCMCCGGWFLDVDTMDVKKYNLKSNLFNFYKLPSNSGINLEKDSFPINVKVNFKTQTDACVNFIDILTINSK